MKIKDLFDYKYGVNLELINCIQTNKKDFNSINFVARTSENNGVVARVKTIENIIPQKAGTISLAVSGSVLSCFVQTEDYYSGRDLYVLTPKIDLSLEQKLFYAMCINKNAYRYSYGRAANKTFPDIDIPEISKCNDIIGLNKVKTIQTKNINRKMELCVDNWEKFYVSDLFFLNGIRGSINSLICLETGNGRIVSTTENDNGIIGCYNINTPYKNKITVSFNGACGYFAYHEYDFNATADVGVLNEKFILNKYIAMFLITILNKISYKYQYGRKLTSKRLGNECILLPTKNGVPDWQFMEDYIKSLPYGDRI